MKKGLIQWLPISVTSLFLWAKKLGFDTMTAHFSHKFISLSKETCQYCHWTWHGKFAWLYYQLQYDVAHPETAHYLVSCVLSVFCKACGHSWHNRSKFMACAPQQVRPPIWLTSLAFLKRDVALDLWWGIQGKPLCLTLNVVSSGFYCLVFVANLVGQEHNYNWVGELCILFAPFNNWEFPYK